MAISEKDIQVLEDHHFGRISKEDQRYYDIRIVDEDFKKYVAEHRLISEVIRGKGRENLKAKLSILESNLSSKKSKIHKLKMIRPWLVAASIALMVSIITIFQINQSNETDIFNQYYAPYPNLIDPLTKGSQEGEPSVFQLYELQKYHEAISGMKGTVQSKEVIWYKAQSLIALSNLKEADTLLASIASDSLNEYSSPAQWYRALVLLKMGDVDTAKNLLAGISNNRSHPYYSQAQELLREL